MRYRTVLFDLDGTLVDSGAMILASFRHATTTVLRRELPDEVFAAHIGGRTLEEQMRLIDAERTAELVLAYREHNEPLHAALQAFEGVERLLELLAAEGRTLGLVTAKRRASVEQAFALLPLGHLFGTVVAADDTERHKPHPEPVLTALERLGARPEDAAFVGDSPFDVAAGNAAGVFTVAVAWGGIHPRERVDEERPDAVVESPWELLDVL